MVNINRIIAEEVKIRVNNRTRLRLGSLQGMNLLWYDIWRHTDREVLTPTARLLRTETILALLDDFGTDPTTELLEII